MNRTLDSFLRGPLAIAAVLALAVATLAVLVNQGVTAYIVPPPQQVGQQFFTSLKSHNFDAAHSHLSQSLQAAVSTADLQARTRQLEQANHGVYQASGEQSTQQGQTATADVKLTLEDGREQTVQVPLALEQGLWKITSLAPLEALLGSP